MSWKECGCKPGTIHGPEKCPKQCSDCDGAHHFYIETVDADPEETCTGESVDLQFKCKHCSATADALDEDDDEPEQCPACNQAPCSCVDTESQLP